MADPRAAAAVSDLLALDAPTPETWQPTGALRWMRDKANAAHVGLQHQIVSNLGATAWVPVPIVDADT